MRTPEGSVIRREDYAPAPFQIEEVRLDFRLDPVDTQVTAVSQICRRDEHDPSSAVPLELQGDDLTLLGVAIDGHELSAEQFSVTPQSLVVHAPPTAAFDLTVRTRIDAAGNTRLMGLYLSNGNFFTQCEAEGFRRITYFLDRPDVMARYTVTLRAERERFPVLLSNGNLIAQGPDERPGWHQATWVDPFPKPSYLFAVVAGRFVAQEQQITTARGRQALLQVWVEPGNEDKTEHAMASLVRAIRWDEARFGLELDLERFMIVAVSDFNMGAMENKGLNIFNTKYVFANPRIATDDDFANIESVVGHEYFHNWTGNRVTCRDWFQLTLKEGLTVFRDQEFSADMLAEQADSPQAAASARAVKRIDDVRVLRAAQFPEDAGPMAHPIRPDRYQEINNFYTVTVYEKGAEVVRMLQTLLGRDGFARGLQLYFERHDGQAVACDDFIAAMADASRRDLTKFLHWYSQAGTPRVKVQGHWDADQKRYTLTLEQSCPPSPGQAHKQPLLIPFAFGLVGPDGQDLPLGSDVDSKTLVTTRILEFGREKAQWQFEGIEVEPVASLLRDFSAPVIVEFPYTDAQLAFLAANDSDPFNRWEAMQRLLVNCMLAMLADRAAGNTQPSTGVSLCIETVVQAFARTLKDSSLDPAFKEQMLTLPSEGYVAEQLDPVDPVAVREVRNSLRAQIARALSEDWLTVWRSLQTQGPYRPDPASAARRGLRNLALSYWVQTGETDAFEAAYRQFNEADNMTLRFGALTTLVNSPAPEAAQALVEFEHLFADEPLAMDKWFSLQASRHRQPGQPPVLEQVRALLDHPAYSLRNPNKVRALVGSFCNANLAEFHAEDGSGYRFWAEQVQVLDRLNPQVAARLSRAMDRWRKFTPDRQQQMRVALKAVAGIEGLSTDVAEIIQKALSAEPS
jgi:aminopeptidase N